MGISLLTRSSKTTAIPEPRHIDVVTKGLRSLLWCPDCGIWLQQEHDRRPLQVQCESCGDSAVIIISPSSLMISHVVPMMLNYLESRQQSSHGAYPDLPSFPLITCRLMSRACKDMAAILGFTYVDANFASYSWRRGGIVDAIASKMFEDSNIEVFFRFATDCWKI